MRGHFSIPLPLAGEGIDWPSQREYLCVCFWLLRKMKVDWILAAKGEPAVREVGRQEYMGWGSWKNYGIFGGHFPWKEH